MVLGILLQSFVPKSKGRLIYVYLSSIDSRLSPLFDMPQQQITPLLYICHSLYIPC